MHLKKIFIVIVLYKNRLEESKTIKTLSNSINETVNLMVFDNSPNRQYVRDKFVYNQFNVKYYHDETNQGLSKAYNKALVEAKIFNANWLLLLDQDTIFNKNYIDEILSLDIDNNSSKIVSILPKVTSSINSTIISPTKMFLGGVCRPISKTQGVINTSITGINSGTLLSVPFLDSINGFSSKYSLDMLDHWYFREIINKGKSVYIMKSIIIQNLSVQGNFEENVTFNRYKQLIKAELFFFKEQGLLSLFIYKFRLFYRVLKQIRFKNSEYFKFTLKNIF